ncbi:hypothetical protein KDW98_12200 [Burkholderia vietnamiensis]|nr:hypothetical protein [Burkholderia vietnamiensis]
MKGVPSEHVTLGASRSTLGRTLEPIVHVSRISRLTWSGIDGSAAQAALQTPNTIPPSTLEDIRLMAFIDRLL